MTYYSIAAAARELNVQRKTLYEWIDRGYIPAPKARAMAGSNRDFWTEEEMTKVRQYRKQYYWGLGKRKTGKKRRTIRTKRQK